MVRKSSFIHVNSKTVCTFTLPCTFTLSQTVTFNHNETSKSIAVNVNSTHSPYLEDGFDYQLYYQLHYTSQE